METTWVVLAAALAGGGVALAVRLPPLVGFLVAGFALHATGVEEPGWLAPVADLGITLLLFGIGLKFDIRTLLRKEVWLPGAANLVASAVVLLAGLAVLTFVGPALVRETDADALVLVALTLAFSSTVLAVKLLEDQSLDTSLVGRTVIGVLVLQDLVAVAILAFAHGDPPKPWAALLLLLVPAAWLIGQLQSRLGRDEMRPLYGVVMALVPGYALFDAAGLEGDLGALVMGLLLGTHHGAAALSKSLLAPKDLLLVAFFLSIGFAGEPRLEHLVIALGLLLLLPAKALGFTALFWFAGMRRRTSLMTAKMLTNYSEFALVVAVALAPATLGEEWVTVLGTSVAFGMVVSSVIAQWPDALTGATRRVLPDRPAERLHPEDRPIDLGDARAVVLGMGRVGQGCYRQLHDRYGLRVIGVEIDARRAARLRDDELRVVEGDATDPEFWTRLRASEVDIVVLAMPFHGHNLAALAQLRAQQFDGTVAAVAQFDADLTQALGKGADTGVQLYAGAGAELADQAAQAAGLEEPSSGGED